MHKEQYNPEVEHSFEPVVNLFEMTESHVQHLAERIKKSDGTVRIFVHPAFGLLYDMKDEVPEEEYEKYKKISKATVKAMVDMLKMDPDKCPPIILMEEEKMAGQMTEILSGTNQGSKNELYTLVTQNGESTPLILKEDLQAEGTKDEEARIEDVKTDDPNLSRGESWSLYANLLAVLGVKKVILAGGAVKYKDLSGEDLEGYRQQLDIVSGDLKKQREAKGARNTDYTPSFCLGTAMIYLSKLFQVEVSNYSFPDTLADRRRIEFPPISDAKTGSSNDF